MMKAMPELDLEGLQVAFLGVALAHYLDVQTGEILDVPLDAPAPGDPRRYRRIPTRTPETEAADRVSFLEQLPASAMRDHLAHVVDDPTRFRHTLMEDRNVEKKFFHFKNDQATAAIAEWLKAEGLS